MRLAATPRGRPFFRRRGLGPNATFAVHERILDKVAVVPGWSPDSDPPDNTEESFGALAVEVVGSRTEVTFSAGDGPSGVGAVLAYRVWTAPQADAQKGLTILAIVLAGGVYTVAAYVVVRRWQLGTR